MPRLYIRFYLTLLGSLALFAFAVVALWHRAGGPLEQSDANLATLVQNQLAPPGAPQDTQQATLTRMAASIDARMTLYSADWRMIAHAGAPMPPLRRPGNTHDAGDMGSVALPEMRFERPQSYVRLPDGRRLLSDKPLGAARPHTLLHGLLALLTLGIGIAAYPLVRYITRRLERLQQGVESLGAGDLRARVAVEGKDEVARLAQSFNRAADQIERLIEAQKSLLANASHELRTPLARIRLALELSAQQLEPRRKAGLEQDIAELDYLIDEILLASRLGAVGNALELEEIDLLALAAEECARYDEAILNGATVSLRGDARLLRRLLRNLLENAHRHGQPPAYVRIERDAAMATLTVWDSGPGIPPEEFERVFEPFYRRRGTRDNLGAGLGLALVRQIARRHGGDARCAALPDGRSSFVITLLLDGGQH